MAAYRHGTDIPVNILFADMDGSPIAPERLTYRVYDEKFMELVGSTVVEPPFSESDSHSIVVPAAANTIADEASRGYRNVEVRFHLSGDREVIVDSNYILERADFLRVMDNSYQTLGQAEMVAADLPELGVWSRKSRSEKQSALVDAYSRLGMLKYRVPLPNDPQRYVWFENSILHGDHRRLTVNRLNELNESEFLQLSERFRQAICRAQVVEADIILDGDPVGRQRRHGLMSHTIGEVSQMFRPGKPLILPVSEMTMRYLTGFVSWSVSIARGS